VRQRARLSPVMEYRPRALVWRVTINETMAIDESEFRVLSPGFLAETRQAEA